MDLNRRPCRIGTSINTRREKHGEGNVTALDIPVREYMLDAAELNSLLQEDRAHGVLFNHAKGGSLIEPVFRTVKALRLKDKIEEVEVQIEWAGSHVMLLAPCNLSKIALEPRVGGLTAASFAIQCTPKLDSLVAQLLEKLDGEVEVTVRGIGEQRSLDLEHADADGNGDEDDDEDDDTPARTRKPRARKPAAVDAH